MLLQRREMSHEDIDDYYRQKDSKRRHTDDWQDDDGEDAHGRGGESGDSGASGGEE